MQTQCLLHPHTGWVAILQYNNQEHLLEGYMMESRSFNVEMILGYLVVTVSSQEPL